MNTFGVHFCCKSIILLVEMGRVDFAALLLWDGLPNARQTNHGSSIHQSVSERVADFATRSIDLPLASRLAQKRRISCADDCEQAIY